MELKHKLKINLEKIYSSKLIKEDIVVIDSVLPNKEAVGPRNSDLIEFAKKLSNFRYYTMYPMKPGNKAWYSHTYGMTQEQFNKKLGDYEKMYPETRGKIKFLSSKKRYQINLAYTYFLAETYTLLPFLEKNKVPFVFLLNPGGAFGINNKSSDKMLSEVLSSKFFRKVIVNQEYCQEYLIENKLCSPQDIIYDFSGSAQFKQADVVTKKLYKKDKQTFDLCFVAAKYSPKGIDKGYDLFIAAAKQLVKHLPDVRFHVVGGFDESEINVSKIADSIKFYGYLSPLELPDFYASMDIYMSPSRPFKLYKGGFDGFPLSAGAMYCGVCGFNTDELHLNREFKSDELVIIRAQVNDIVEKVKYYYSNLDELYVISRKGQKRAQFFYDIEKHIDGRIRLFRKLSQIYK